LHRAPSDDIRSSFICSIGERYRLDNIRWMQPPGNSHGVVSISPA